MKKMMILLSVTALLLSACGNKEKDFEEFQKVELEVSDYSPTASPTAAPTQTPEITPVPTVEPPEETAEVPTAEPKKEASEPSSSAESAAEKQQSKKQAAAKTEKQTENQPAAAVKKQQTAKEEQTPVQPIAEEPESTANNLEGKIICIDAGHGIFSEGGSEKLAPNSTEEKPAFIVGTQGSTYNEEEINLAVALKIKEKLTALGATVVMTRENEYTSLSNIGRAELANSSGANAFVRLHADGTKEGGSGMTALVPSAKYISQALADEGYKLGSNILRYAARETGAVSRGVYKSSGMTAFNWSTVPTALLEMGFITNPSDEQRLADPAYQERIAEGVVKGLNQYFK